MRVQIWDVKTGAEVRQFTAPAHLDGKQRAFSPGRRYLALVAEQKDRVLLYDLTTGQPAGEAPLPPKSKCQGLAFAPDGKSLAGLFKLGSATRLLAWDLATGKSTADHALEKAVVPNSAAFRGPALDWLLDGGGWLLYSQALLDDKSGAIYWRIPVEDAYAGAPRHIFGDGRLAYVKSVKGKKTLVIEPLPMDQITAALKTARGG